MRNVLIVAAAAILVPGVAQAAAFTNGNFEADTVVAPEGFLQVNAGSAGIAGWTVSASGASAGSVDLVSNAYWDPAEGVNSVDLDGNNAGTLSQTFDTIIGKSYVVNYMLAGNPVLGPPVKTLNVFATGGALDAVTFDTTNTSTRNMGWTAKSYAFTASAIETTLSFQSTTGTGYGPAIDGVSVVAAVPEPATWALMIGGFGLVGGTLRRRRSTGLAIA